LLTLEEAKSLLLAEISDDYDGIDWAVIDESTIEKPWGWVFFYQARQYVETGDDSFAVYGPGPVIVNARTGELHKVEDIVRPLDRSIAEYEKKHGLA
jgi:hypothetical protein